MRKELWPRIERTRNYMISSTKASALFRGVCALALAALGSVCANTLTVSNRNDSGAGSLRQAIADAAAGDIITFDIKGTITLTSGPLTIARDLTIQGPGPIKLRISGNHASRVFVINSGAVAISGITITGGMADIHSPDPTAVGGGVLSYVNLTLSDAIVSDNSAVGDKSGGTYGTGWAIAGAIKRRQAHATRARLSDNPSTRQAL